jgi:hypothetical protein
MSVLCHREIEVRSAPCPEGAALDEGDLPRWLTVLLVLTAASSFAVGSYLEIFHGYLLLEYPYWASLLSSVTGFTTSASLITIVVRRIQIRRSRATRILRLTPRVRRAAAVVGHVLALVVEYSGVHDGPLAALGAPELVTGPELHARLANERLHQLNRAAFASIVAMREATDRLIAPLREVERLIAGRRARDLQESEYIPGFTATEFARFALAHAQFDAIRSTHQYTDKYWSRSRDSSPVVPIRADVQQPVVNAPPDAEQASRLAWERIRREMSEAANQIRYQAPLSSDDEEIPSYSPDPWTLFHPWTVGLEHRQEIRAHIEKLATSVAAVGFDEERYEEITRLIGVCGRLARGWEESADVMVEADTIFGMIFKVAKIKTVTGISLADLSSRLSDCIATCQIPLRLAVELVFLWAALLDELQSRSLAALLRTSLTD